jgi:hypothetical protein
MSKWRRIALEKLPRFKNTIETSYSPMALWIELLQELETAYSKEVPDEEVIKEIFAYASWCLRYSGQSKSYDMFTEVIVAFYEHLPTNKKIRRDLYKRMSRDDINYIGEHWLYLLDEEEAEQFKKDFPNHSLTLRTRV